MTSLRARSAARRASTSRAFVIIVAALALGLAGGLYYGWVIAPVKYVDADPASLHQSFKDDYVLMIATAYSADGDLEAARAQLNTLGLAASGATPESLGQAVAAAAQRLTAAGLPPEDAERLAALAAALDSATEAAP